MILTNLISYLRRFINRKLLIILVIILIAGSSLFGYIQRSRQKPLQFAAVKQQDLISTVAASGTLAGKQTANLKFKSSGKLAYLNIKSGQTVAQGQVVATLDTTDLSIQLQQAQNSLRDKQATVDKIVDDIHLFQYGNNGTSGETETQRATRTQAEVARDNAFDNVRASQQTWQDATLISPIAGLVTKADIISGQNISFSDLIAQVVDTSEIYFDSQVDESDIAKVALDQNARVALNSYPDQTFTGKVVQILPTTKLATSGATIVIVRIKLDNAKINFISDLNGQADIEVAQAQNVLTIPQDSLVDDQFVYLQSGNLATKKAITIGISSDTDIEVKTGLNESDKVVTNPADIGK